MIVLHTLGVVAIRVGARRVLPSATRAFASLIYLGLERGRRVPRGELQELLFPGQGERTAAHNLRQLMYRVRGLGAPVEADEHAISLAASDVADDFSAVCGGAAIESEVAKAVAGGVLPGYAPTFSDAFERWVEAQRTRIGHDLVRVLVAQLTELRGAGRWRDLEPLATACLALDPLNEEATLALAESLALNGQKARAVQLLDTYIEDVGPYGKDLRIPAHVLRTRISEHVPEPSYRRLGPGPFVGRDAEMAELWRHYQHAKRGEPRTVVIHGEPGIGKTRLATEFLKAAALDGATCLKVECAPHDVRRPLGVFVDLVPKLLEAPGGLGVAPEAMEFLRRLTSGPIARPDQLALTEPASVSSAIEAAVVDVIAAVSSEQTLVIAIDDAHFADPISRRLLADCVAPTLRAPTLLIFTSGDGMIAPVASGLIDRISRVKLSALDTWASRRLMLALDQDRRTALEPSQLDDLLRIAVGNPLYMEAALADCKDVHSDPRNSTTLRQLLHQRVAALDIADLHVLAACSLVSHRLPLGIVDDIAGFEEQSILSSFQRLHDRGLIHDEGRTIDRVHPLVREAALDRTGPSVTRLIHRRLARYMSSHLGDSPDPSALWDCALHWQQAGESANGIELLRAYARYCLQIGQPTNAFNILQNALEISTPVDIQETLGEAIRAADLAELFPEVRRLFAKHASLRPLVRTHDDLELIEINASRHDGVPLVDRAEQLWECLSTVDASPSHRLRAAASYIVYADGWFEPEKARSAYLAVSQLGETDGDCSILWQNVEVLFNLHFGDPALAVQCANRSMELIKSSSDPWRATAPAMNAAIAYFIGGAFKSSVETLCYVREVALARGLRQAAAQAASLLCMIHLDYGKITAAKNWNAVAERTGAVIGSHTATYSYLSNKIEFALLEGNGSEARKWLEHARTGYAELASPHNNCIDLGYSLLIDEIDGRSASNLPRIDELIARHNQARNSWSHDAFVLGLVNLLQIGSGKDRARVILNQYLSTQRRERTPLRAGLARLANAWEIVHAFPRTDADDDAA